MGEVSRLAKAAPVLLLIASVSGCSIGGPSTFVLNSASVDESYICPTAASDLAYTLHATIGVQNGTASTVTIRSVAVVMILASVKGGWLENVGDRYGARGVTVVLVEQNAFAALELSDRSYVLEQGRVALSGTGAELLDNPHVKSAYLGA